MARYGPRLVLCIAVGNTEAPTSFPVAKLVICDTTNHVGVRSTELNPTWEPQSRTTRRIADATVPFGDVMMHAELAPVLVIAKVERRIAKLNRSATTLRLASNALLATTLMVLSRLVIVDVHTWSAAFRTVVAGRSPAPLALNRYAPKATLRAGSSVASAMTRPPTTVTFANPTRRFPGQASQLQHTANPPVVAVAVVLHLTAVKLVASLFDAPFQVATPAVALRIDARAEIVDSEHEMESRLLLVPPKDPTETAAANWLLARAVTVEVTTVMRRSVDVNVAAPPVSAEAAEAAATAY